MDSVVKKAILAQLLTVFLLAGMNVFAKLFAETHHPVETVFYRSLLCLACIIAYILYTGKTSYFKTERPGLHVKRSLSGNLSVFIVYTAFSMMPMADMTALLLSVPIVASLFAILMIGENASRSVWGAIFLGFAGVLCIVRPTGDVPLNGLAFGLMAVVMVSWVNVQIRHMAQTERPLTTVFYFFLCGTICTGAFMPFYGSLPQGIDIVWVLGVAVTALLSQLLKTEAIRHITVSTATALSYTSIIWGSLAGWLIWNDVPGLHVWVGTVIIMISSYMIVRSRKLERPDPLPSSGT